MPAEQLVAAFQRAPGKQPGPAQHSGTHTAGQVRQVRWGSDARRPRSHRKLLLRHWGGAKGAWGGYEAQRALAQQGQRLMGKCGDHIALHVGARGRQIDGTVNSITVRGRPSEGPGRSLGPESALGAGVLQVRVTLLCLSALWGGPFLSLR
ncbi:hypothetical protein AAFF_G00077180 [Aldrovandia affinis]|uniref:Uncharacterized protein n=1 Tax=Aldrovandia affinis TaxID=143900 RepID=A0AAD7WDV5_9TELE|nr:hypothetical protein AAFF_G00077180 [Aldrovandia affinis]